MGDIVRRQLSFLGHVLRKDELEKLVVPSYVDGKRARGRQRETFLTYLGNMKHKLPMSLLKWLRIELFGPSCVHTNLCLRTRYLIMMMNVLFSFIDEYTLYV